MLKLNIRCTHGALLPIEISIDSTPDDLKNLLYSVLESHHSDMELSSADGQLLSNVPFKMQRIRENDIIFVSLKPKFVPKLTFEEKLNLEDYRIEDWRVKVLDASFHTNTTYREILRQLEEFDLRAIGDPLPEKSDITTGDEVSTEPLPNIFLENPKNVFCP